MRSVVVVLPASMCAMIPMLRVFWRLNLRGMVVCSEVVARPDEGKKRGPPGPRALPVMSRFASLCAQGLHLEVQAPRKATFARLSPPRGDADYTRVSRSRCSCGQGVATLSSRAPRPGRRSRCENDRQLRAEGLRGGLGDGAVLLRTLGSQQHDAGNQREQ